MQYRCITNMSVVSKMIGNYIIFMINRTSISKQHLQDLIVPASIAKNPGRRKSILLARNTILLEWQNFKPISEKVAASGFKCKCSSCKRQEWRGVLVKRRNILWKRFISWAFRLWQYWNFVTEAPLLCHQRT